MRLSRKNRLNKLSEFKDWWEANEEDLFVIDICGEPEEWLEGRYSGYVSTITDDVNEYENVKKGLPKVEKYFDDYDEYLKFDIPEIKMFGEIGIAFSFKEKFFDLELEEMKELMKMFFDDLKKLFESGNFEKIFPFEY